MRKTRRGRAALSFLSFDGGDFESDVVLRLSSSERPTCEDTNAEDQDEDDLSRIRIIFSNAGKVKHISLSLLAKYV